MNEPTIEEIKGMIDADRISIAQYSRVLKDYPCSPYWVQLHVLEEHLETMQWLLSIRDGE